MKKFSWILALLAALALVFVGVGCGGGGGDNPPPPPPAEDLEITDAEEIADLLEAKGYFGTIAGGDDPVVKTDGNKAIFNYTSVNDPTGSDNYGFKLSFPADVEAGHLSMEVTFKLVEVVSLTGGKAKIGFKANDTGSGDLQPYDDYEIVFDAEGDEFTQSFPLFQPNKLPNKFVCFQHNKYGVGANATAKYTLEITKIVFKGGEVVACCDDCEEDCANCAAGECTDDCTVTCCMPPAEGTFSITDFTESKRTDGYGDTYVSGNTWQLATNYQQIKFAVEPTVLGTLFKSVTVEYTTDATGTVSFCNVAGTQDTTIPGGYQGKIDLGAGTSPVTINLNNNSEIAAIAFESKTSAIEITINKVTFNARDPEVAVESVSVTPTTVTLETVGATQLLTPTVLPAGATNKAVTYSSSDAAVATVNTSGVVTAVANGTATITVTTVDGSKTATCEVTVTLTAEPTESKTADITLSAMSGSGSISDVSWAALMASKLDSFVRVYVKDSTAPNNNGSGQFGGTTNNVVANGNAIYSLDIPVANITSKNTNIWNGIFDEIELWEPTGAGGYRAVTNITGVPAAGVVGVPVTLSGTVLPINADVKTIVWSVDAADGTIADNVFTPSNSGTIEVTATIVNGLTASTPYTKVFEIEVEAPVTNDIVVDDFSEASYVNGAVNTGGNSWSIEAGYKQVRFDLGQTINSVTHPTMTIEGSSDGGFTLKFFDATDTEISGSVQYGKTFTSGTYTTDLPGDVKYVAFDSGDTAALTITIDSITFEVAD